MSIYSHIIFTRTKKAKMYLSEICAGYEVPEAASGCPLDSLQAALKAVAYSGIT